MRFYSRKKPQKKTDILIERVREGKCDDFVISELKVAASELTEPADMEQAITGLMDIATKSDNPVSIAYAMKSLLAFRPLTAGLEDDLEMRAQALLMDKSAMSTKVLQEAIIDLVYIRVSERALRALPFMGTLISALDERSGKTGNISYNTLMIVAANQPELFNGQTAPLIRMLGSINKVTRIETSKIIAVLAMSHPEYVESAEKTLLDMSSFNPDGDVKNAASEAYQILSTRLKTVTIQPPQVQAVQRPAQEPPQQAGGLAEIMRRKAGKEPKPAAEGNVNKRLLSLATNFARKADRAYKIDGETQAEYEENESRTMTKIMDDFSEIAELVKAESRPADVPAAEAAPAAETETSEEAELRKMMEKVQDDFTITAGSILDAIGMGHLAKNPPAKETRHRTIDNAALNNTKRVRPASSPDISVTRAPEKPPAKAEEEPEVNPKEFIASIESIISNIDNLPSGQPAPPEAMAVPVAPAAPLAAETDFIPAPNALPVSPSPLNDDLPEAAPEENTQADSPVEIARPEKPDTAVRPEEPEKRPRPAIVPQGVRISAMKFKSLDQSKAKKPAPAKISIKPHIKPLAKIPADVIKNAPPRQQPVGGAPEIKTDGGTAGYVICHACNARMPDDSQRCAICGSDLKEPKVRCRNCGEITPLQAGKCTRCGTNLNE
ncbi:MAG: hypothetical protein A4E28_01556 [Methanocella sp. PtaU1.Bin125]|nr:MAG: hypothetical protein A4E28_01556 [Methanocella sp. PtaU1.Bin125]